jgi:hypothetical protein
MYLDQWLTGPEVVADLSQQHQPDGIIDRIAFAQPAGPKVN